LGFNTEQTTNPKSTIWRLLKMADPYKYWKSKPKSKKIQYEHPVTGKTQTALDSTALQKQLGYIATQDSIKQVKYVDDWLKQLSELRLRAGEFEKSGDAPSLKVTRRRIKDVEAKIGELDKKITPPTEGGKVEPVVKKQSFLNEFLFGSAEEQETKALKISWVENYAEQEREAFVNRELEVPPEYKSNPEKWYNKENMKRTNQWYKQRAEEAYAEEMKIKDPAGIAPFIKK